MRRQGGGQIINIGSVAAYIAIPYQSMYCASKAALQSMSFALRNETKPFGINVSVVHPGDLKTGFTENRKKAEAIPKDLPYAKSYVKSLGVMEKDEQNGGDPVCVAKAISRIISRKHPPVSVTVGFKYKLFAFLSRVVPAALREKIVRMIYT
jgi:short-subunit dehydrogenase